MPISPDGRRVQHGIHISKLEMQLAVKRLQLVVWEGRANGLSWQAISHALEWSPAYAREHFREPVAGDLDRQRREIGRLSMRLRDRIAEMAAMLGLDD